ncbi:Hint domain-containing protein [Nioella sp. MMSF_3534]|uniref:Hint domain-containing protein n=1 Tax=Nioella sp. MMSF_3534 TaxID=3046720 RepID=UPI00273E8C69|nr:Hint domain-containing protein [Nioella sp. MMSF_3534]
MASYTFDRYKYYNRSGDSMTQQGSSLGTDVSTITEVAPDIDGDFTPNESTLSNNWGGGALEYFGTFEFNGNTFLVFEDAAFGYFLASPDSSLGLGDFPAGWSFADVVANTTPLCFAVGTLISNLAGEVQVERLKIGDLVQAADGSLVQVKWIGRQTVMNRFGPAERLMPVRFAAGSLGDDLPHTDLTVTADHGMLVDGVICHAGALVNGTTITQVPLAEMGESYTVYHIETEEHEIILANGAPAETFIDNVSRRVFDNYAEFEALYGDVPEMEELPYPRAMSARQVPDRIANRLTKRQVA